MAHDRDPATPAPSHVPAEGGTQLADCPECGAPAECLARWTWESTDGPLEHVKIRCVLGHWFAMPVWMLDSATAGDVGRRR